MHSRTSGLARFVGIVALAALVYLGCTGAIGAYVGLQIHKTIHRNAVSAIGSHLLGMRRIDAYALAKANLPAFIVRSPTFWIGLRSTQ
ncbi:hypothetical protein EPN44_07865 [bacterium]|nr:MAG: hypothetical protein EPN44_07865 [bacterium]